MEVKFLRADDWVGIYVDGQLVRESHSIQEEDVSIAITGTKPETFWTFDERFWDSGSCPRTWQEVLDKVEELGIENNPYG